MNTTGGNDIAREQTFERQVNSERSGFESNRNERRDEQRDNGSFASRDRI